jgi:hypothetical protein
MRGRSDQASLSLELLRVVSRRMTVQLSDGLARLSEQFELSQR